MEHISQATAEGKWFRVDPKSLDESLFQKERKDENQETTRILILEAFRELKRNPKKYAKTFEIIIPERTKARTGEEFEEQAQNLGGFFADWVFQALQWAQIISNGEPWENICNVPDTAKWYRAVIWKNGDIRLVGGFSNDKYKDSASPTEVYFKDHDWELPIYAAVPLVARYSTEKNEEDT